MVKIIPTIIIIIFSLFAGWGLVHSGLPPTHDGEYHIVRFYEFDRTLRSGYFYPRWAPDLAHGNGIPLFTYVYPLPNYIASLFHLIGISFIDSFKLSMLFAVIVGAIGMYVWSRYLWGTAAGLTSAVVYTFAPYHFVDFIIRGSIGEIWALSFFPIFMYFITKAIKEKHVVSLLLSSITLAGIIFSHNILALSFAPFALSYIMFLFVYYKRSLKECSIFLLFFIFGIGLSAIFWLPALGENNYVTGLQIFDLSRNFADLYQLLIPSWGSGIYGLQIADQMSVQIGAINILVVLVSFISVFLLIKKKNNISWFIIFFLLWFVILFFLMQKISLPIWQTVPLLHYFQFPWRLLSLVILICGFLAGGVIYTFNKKYIATIIILLTVLTTYGYRFPAYYMERSDSYYITRSNFIDGTNSPGNAFSTVWLHGIPTIRGLATTNYTFTTNMPHAQLLSIPLTYFPSWQAMIDGKKTTVLNNNGLVSVYLPRGKHKVAVFFGQTQIENVASIISLLTGLLILTIFLKNWYSKRYAHRA